MPLCLSTKCRNSGGPSSLLMFMGWWVGCRLFCHCHCWGGWKSVTSGRRDPRGRPQTECMSYPGHSKWCQGGWAWNLFSWLPARLWGQVAVCVSTWVLGGEEKDVSVDPSRVTPFCGMTLLPGLTSLTKGCVYNQSHYKKSFQRQFFYSVILTTTGDDLNCKEEEMKTQESLLCCPSSNWPTFQTSEYGK